VIKNHRDLAEKLEAGQNVMPLSALADFFYSRGDAMQVTHGR
jgi:phytoene/squalene synthetase